MSGTITSTVFITTATPYTLSLGSEITIASSANSDGIYTTFSSGSLAPIIVIDGTVIDNSTVANADLYAIQSTSPAEATLDNFGTISAPSHFGVGFNNGLIINEAGGTISGQGGIRIGTGSLGSTIINSGTILGTSQQGIASLNPASAGFITNTSGGLIRGGTSGGSISESGIYIQSGTVTNAGTIAQGATGGFSVDFFGTGGKNELILDPGQVLKGVATASGTGNILALASGSTIGTLTNPGNYFGFSTLSVASGADWTIGTSSSATSISGISTIANFGTVNILGSITGTTVDLEGNGAGSEVMFNGSSSGTHLYNTVKDFGATDTIVISGFNLQPGEQIVYNYLNGVLSVSANGSSNRVTEQFTLSGPGGVNFPNSTGVTSSGAKAGVFTFTTLANGSLMITENPGSYTFTGAADTNFNNGANYVGGVAPGYTLYPGELVSIVSGTASIGTSPSLVNNGTILVSGTAVLTDTGSISGTGTIGIAGGGQVTLGGSTTVTNEISFGTGGTALSPNLLDLSGTGSTTTQLGSIANFGTFDTILVSGFTLINGDTLIDFYDPTTGVLHVNEFNTGTKNGDENFTATITGPGAGTLNTGNFFVSFGASGLLISDAPCFAAGTRILTPNGEIAVEDIKAGDAVLTAREGQEASAEVIWVGQRTIDLARHAMPEKVRPIRILAGAFGEGLPQRDLRVSPDHALYIDGHLIEAKTLVNGVTVIVEQNTRHVTYHHIELASHDVVLAEGLPAETYLESGNRGNFENDAAPLVLHPDFVTTSRAAACAPLLVEGEIVFTARRRLLDRAVALGFTATGSVDLTVEAGGEKILPEADMDGELLFVLPAGAKSVTLLSGTGVPAELTADPSDRRVLGVDVAAITLIAGGKRIAIALDDAAHEGFHAMEAGHRWTNGAAKIALPAHSGRAVLEVAINGQAARWSVSTAA
jgi:hypothetical protein